MNDNKQNPYAKTKTNLEHGALTKALSSFKLILAKSRIGRLRYISFTLGTLSIALVLSFFLVPIPLLGNLLVLFILIAALLIILVLSVKRCHDVNIPTWLAVVLFVLMPLTTLIFYLVPGNKGENKYGVAPPENSTSVVVSATLLLIVYSLSVASLTLFFVVGPV